MVYSLVDNYGLGKQMLVYRPEPRSFDQLTEYHADGKQLPRFDYCALGAVVAVYQPYWLVGADCQIWMGAPYHHSQENVLQQSPARV